MTRRPGAMARVVVLMVSGCADVTPPPRWPDPPPPAVAQPLVRPSSSGAQRSSPPEAGAASVDPASAVTPADDEGSSTAGSDETGQSAEHTQPEVSDVDRTV